MYTFSKELVLSDFEDQTERKAFVLEALIQTRKPRCNYLLLYESVQRMVAFFCSHFIIFFTFSVVHIVKNEQKSVFLFVSWLVTTEKNESFPMVAHTCTSTTTWVSIHRKTVTPTFKLSIYLSSSIIKTRRREFSSNILPYFFQNI